MKKDPICKMEVDEEKAKFSTVKNGKKYFFCSNNCYDKFAGKRNQAETKKLTLSISGMHCASCAMTIESALKKWEYKMSEQNAELQTFVSRRFTRLLLPAFHRYRKIKLASSR